MVLTSPRVAPSIREIENGRWGLLVIVHCGKRSVVIVDRDKLGSTDERFLFSFGAAGTQALDLNCVSAGEVEGD